MSFAILIMTLILARIFSQEWSQIMSMFICTIPFLNEGLLLSWPSAAVLILTNPANSYGISEEETSYFTVLPCLVYIVTAIPIGWVVNKIGRRKTLMISTITYAISGFLLGIGGSIWVYYVARLIQGLSTSSTYCAAPLYCGEVSVPKIRGRWGNLMAIQYFLGIVIILAVGSYFSLSGMSYVCMAVPVFNLVLLCCIPDSPYYLIMKDRHDDAKVSLQWLRQREDVTEEVSHIACTVQRKLENWKIGKIGTFKDVFTNKANRRAIIAMMVVRVAQQLSGISALIAYAHTFFAMAGGDMNISTCAILSGVAQVVFSIIGALLVNVFNRRSTLIYSGIATVLFLFLMATYFFLDTVSSVDLSFMSWFPIVGMILYLFSYSMGLSTVPMILGSELFSTSVKEKSIALHNILFGVLIACTTKIFQSLSQFGLYVPLTFFAFMCFTHTMACYFVLPETKDRTLDEIQVELSNSKKTDNNFA